MRCYRHRLNQSRYSEVEFRTGMLGMAIIDVDTGRILALFLGALSDCTRGSLERPKLSRSNSAQQLSGQHRAPTANRSVP